ncbi:hypothetical protein [Salinarimonas sp.]|uniref:hypothetical protein n=1 Tax=Salinarimonas sp. TaxID=2766526 RepID=UPI0032D8BADB
MHTQQGWGDHMNGWMNDHMGGFWGWGMGLWGLLLVVLVVLVIAALIKYLRS